MRYNMCTMHSVFVHQSLRSILALAIGALGFQSAGLINSWLGSWVGPLWLISPFFISYFAGMAAGPAFPKNVSLLLGIIVVLAVALIPNLVFVLVETANGESLSHVIDTNDLLPLWTYFFSLGALQGALFWPMGIESREFFNKRSKQKQS